MPSTLQTLYSVPDRPPRRPPEAPSYAPNQPPGRPPESLFSVPERPRCRLPEPCPLSLSGIGAICPNPCALYQIPSSGSPLLPPVSVQAFWAVWNPALEGGVLSRGDVLSVFSFHLLLCLHPNYYYLLLSVFHVFHTPGSVSCFISCSLGSCVSFLVFLPVCDCLHQPTCVQLPLPSLCVYVYKSLCSPLSLSDRLSFLVLIQCKPCIFFLMSCSPVRDVLSCLHVSFRVFSIDLISLKQIIYVKTLHLDPTPPTIPDNFTALNFISDSFK